MPSSLIATIFLLCSGIGLGAASCSWRFLTCERAPTNCSVVLRAVNCSVASDTRRVSLPQAEVELGNVSSLCHVESCRVKGRPCPWTEWSAGEELCEMTTLRRYRSLCCHPQTGERLNASCLPADATDIDSVIDRVKNNPCLGRDDGTESESSSGHGSDEALAISCGVALFATVVMASCCAMLKKKRGQGALPEPAEPLRPLPHAIPDVVVRPEPGQPVNVEYLPSHFKVGAETKSCRETNGTVNEITVDATC